MPPSAKHFNVLLHTLDRAKPERPGRLLAMLDKIAEHFKRRSIVALISDLYENPDELLEALKPYRFLGNDWWCSTCSIPAEIDFPVQRGVAVPGSRERRGSAGRAGGLRGAVPQDDAGAHRRATTKCSEARIDYVLLNTSKPLDEALFSYLGNRERLMRVR